MKHCTSCGKPNRTTSRFCNRCGSALHPPNATGFLPQQSLLQHGRYCIVERVGQGGMGAVYKALDTCLNQRVVAIKEMSQQGLSPQEQREAIAAFAHEASILTLLQHPSLPHIYEQFEDHGRHYLVMEFIVGETLEQRLTRLQQQRRLMPMAQVLDLAHHLCIVLDYLHSQQPPIVFRDLKPANIMLREAGGIALIDFGIARFFKPGQAKDTVALGSEGYAPPEQYRQATSPRSDIYSLGATLHHVLTGADPSDHPFHFPPFNIQQPLLETLVQRMVALDEARRPQNIQEVRSALDEIIQLRLASIKNTGNAPVLPSVQTLSIAVLLSSSKKDYQLWRGIKKQILAFTTTFPTLTFTEMVLHSTPPDKEQQDAITNAHLVLLLLSPDFLGSHLSIQCVEKIVDRYEKRELTALSILLRPCTLSSHRLQQIPMVPEHSISHTSIYAQEQQIVTVARTIRRILAELLSTGKSGGRINLLNWLLWQLFADGRASCPYFVVDHYALKAIRPSGLDSMLFHLLDLKQDRVVADYILGTHTNHDLPTLLKILAPSLLKAEDVQGIAEHHKPLSFSIP